MSARRLEFGYHPRPLRVRAGQITVEPLADFDATVADMAKADGIDGDWIYALPQQVRGFRGQVRDGPYAARVFGLPKTHAITHGSADSDDQLTFNLWALSFFEGMRLTATEAGFLDATPLRPGKLVDFVLLGNSCEKAIDLAETFWISNRGEPQRARIFAAAVHALFLGQNPRHLQFEEFMLFYTALDACFALAKSLRPPAGHVTHAGRMKWLCDLFGMATPAWADPAAPPGPEVVMLRNSTIHEALFMGEPLGFALHGVGMNRNLTLEMQALICRFLVALIGREGAEYVRSPVGTRQRHGLDLR